MNMDNAHVHAISTYLQIIDYTSVRGGVSVLTNKAEITTSYLIIQKAQIEDGGIYSCENGVVDPAKVKVHVLTGKYLKFYIKLSKCIQMSSFANWKFIERMLLFAMIKNSKQTRVQHS